MPLFLHPRLASGDRIHVWVGTYRHSQVPALQWSLNGSSVAPAVLRGLQQAHDFGQGSFTYTGLYEFSGLSYDYSYHIECATDDGMSASLEVRTLPQEVPHPWEDQGEFNVLIASCYDRGAEPRPEFIAERIRKIPGIRKIHMSLFLGDQVYLDLPTTQDFPSDAAWLADKFEEDYRYNWSQERLGHLFRLAPGAYMPDDHEYWNNYPHAATVIANSWTGDGRDNWEQAARALFEAFQLNGGIALGQAIELDVPPLSFFLADTRSGRDPHRQFLLPPGERNKLRSWIAHLNANDYTGVFVSGQSLFAEAVGGLTGAVADWEMPNYGDYPEIVELLTGAEQDLICITGDVHWSRVLRATEAMPKLGRSQPHTIYEIISSPLTLVRSVGLDQAYEAWDWLAGIFRGRERWPRHSGATTNFHTFPAQPIHGVPTYHCHLPSSLEKGLKGDNVAVLSFTRTQKKVDFKVCFWELHPDAHEPVVVDPNA